MTLRQNLNNWTRVSRFSKITVVVVKNVEKKTIEKISNIDVYEKKQMISICFIEKSVVTLNILVEITMKFMKKSFTKVIEKSFLSCFSIWIFYITSCILTIFLHDLHLLCALLLINKKRSFEINYKKRSKIKIKQKCYIIIKNSID